MISSLHDHVPGSFTSCEPGWSPGCHTEKNAPTGSTKTAMRPCSNTSIGGTITCPPAALTFSAVSSALSTST